MRVVGGQEDGVPQIRLSAREFAEFTAMEGDLDERKSGRAGLAAMQKGAKLHRKLQGEGGPGYESEVALSVSLSCEGFRLLLEGRADGILTEGDSVLIDEIKGISSDPALLEEPLKVHYAQAVCYAFMKKEADGLSSCGVRITYVSMDSEEVRRFTKTLSSEEIDLAFYDLLRVFMPFGSIAAERSAERDASVRSLRFPYPFRPGQERLVRSVYRTVEQGRSLFLNASTGIGKTLAVLYPALHAVAEGMAQRIFYLTARTVTGRAAMEALSILEEEGAKVRTVRITAKEKVCFLSEPSCTAEDCPYAKGYFDRHLAALLSLLKGRGTAGFDEIRRTAAEHSVCPYELSLEFAAFSDVVVCDYNYVFDPDARLGRLLDDKTQEPVLLVDEAHNLPSRAREMYSAVLVKEDILALRRLVKERAPRLYRSLGTLNKAMLAWKKEFAEEQVIDFPYRFAEDVRAALFRFDEYLDREEDGRRRQEALPYYFLLRSFVNVSDEADGEHYASYVTYTEEGAFALKLFCTDPAPRIRGMMEGIRSAVFFSATLLPVRYFRRVLGASPEDYDIYAESPFDPENRLVVTVRDVSSRYTERGPAMYRRIAEAVRDIALSHTGNYLVFFPSHKMMGDVFSVYRESFDDPRIDWVVQQRAMSEADREIFLENYEGESGRSLVGFCVMGGLFSEGIDLTGKRLIGAVVIGTGLPQISAEGELLRETYANAGEDGFDFAYRFPGMNKVLQAGGRVIRTETDRGVIVLMDDRFLSGSYRGLFPREWSNRVVCTASEAAGYVSRFFSAED